MFITKEEEKADGGGPGVIGGSGETIFYKQTNTTCFGMFEET